MSLIEAEFAIALSGKVRRKTNTTGNLGKAGSLRPKATRTAGGAPEVMVKITGYGKGGAHVQAHLTYISRNGQLTMENERGEIFATRQEIRAITDEWKADFSDLRARKNQRDTMHVVFSMPENTPADAVHAATRSFAELAFARNHEYVMVLHTDAAHPHCHVAVKCRGTDGSRLATNPEDVEAWREGFARAMRGQGIECEATPRAARGIVRKAERSVLRHIEAGDRTHSPRPLKIKQLAAAEAARDAAAKAAGQPIADRPWEAHILRQQATVRSAWLAAADALTVQASHKGDLAATFDKTSPVDIRRKFKDFRDAYRANAIRQSRFTPTGRSLPPDTVAGLRDMPRLTMVHNQRDAQVLLPQHAHAGLGNREQGHDARDGVRRPRDGHSGFGSGNEPMQRTADEVGNAVLTKSIRQFVQAMPSIATRRQEIDNAIEKFNSYSNAQNESTGSTLRRD